MGIDCNTSRKENEAMICLRLSNLPQPLPRAPLVAGWSVLPPDSAAFLPDFHKVNPPKNDTRSDPEPPAPGVIRLETLSFHFFNKAFSFVSLPKKPRNIVRSQPMKQSLSLCLQEA